MSHLRTDWLCVATEGDTVDKRVLERQWLIDAAETYNPNLYGALIWPEHEKEYGNFGEVLCTMWQEDDNGLVKLYVQLRPNAYLLEANSRDQLIYFSVELSEDNWRGTGRCYLEGLAVTDTPASVGTTRLRFKKRGKHQPGYYACRVSRNGIKQDNAMKKTNWQSWFNIKPKKFEEAEVDPEEAAPEDKLQVLAEAVNNLEARVTAIETQLSDTQEDLDTVKEVVDTAEFATLRDNVGIIVKNFSKLDETITTLPKRKYGDKSQSKDKGFKFL